MFPDIGKVKKNALPVINEQMVKEWTEVRKQLDAKYKSIIGKLHWDKLSDYTKICKLKEIPEFYYQYFIFFLHKAKESIIEDILQKQINYIISSESHHHRIQKILKEREQQRKKTILSLEIVNGFNQMNGGKNVTISIKNKINELLQSCSTLEQIKEKQKESITILAQDIIQLRMKTRKLVQQVNFWRSSLCSLSDATLLRRFKIIYPHNGMNCIFLPIYDFQFLKTSFLKKQFVIPSEKNPFFLIGKELKRKTEFHQIFHDKISVDTQDYSKFTQQIYDQIPKKQSEEEAKAKQKEKIKMAKEMKQMKDNEKKKRIQSQSKKKGKTDKEKEDNMPMGLKKKSVSVINIQNLLLKNRTRSKKNKKQHKNQDQNSSIQRPRTSQKLLSSPKLSSDKKIENVYKNGKVLKTEVNEKYEKLLNQKLFLQKELKQAKKNEKKMEKLVKNIEKGGEKIIEDQIQKQEQESIKLKKSSIASNNQSFDKRVAQIYQNKSKGKKNSKHQLDKSKDSEIANEKTLLQKELKQKDREIKKYEKLLKKVEKNSLNKQKRYEQAAQKYSQQIDVLKLEIQERKKKNEIKLIDRNKQSRSAGGLYEVKSPRKVNPYVNAAEDNLKSEKSNRRDLQKQIKELNKQKMKLEQIIAKSEGKMLKQKEVFERKLQKYENIIEKLNEEKGSKRKKQDYEIEHKKQRKSFQGLKMYNTTPMKDKSKKKKDKSIQKHGQSAHFFQMSPELKKVKEAKQRKQEVIFEKSEDEENGKSKKESSKKKKGNNIQIIQTKKTIQIIYQRSRKKKGKKEENSLEKEENKELEKVKKQKEALLFQIQREEMKRQSEKKSLHRKSIQNEGMISKYREMIEKERSRKYEMEQKMKEMKRTLYEQFQNRLKKEKTHFYNQKKELLAQIENQKEERLLKEKYLSGQIKLLKEMQSNENQLIRMLEEEKKQKKEKQRELEQQIAKKEELLSLMQIEEIKKGIETEVRKELENIESDEEQQKNQIKEKKQKLQRQIVQMQEERIQELDEIDEQNEKLKNLIERIKLEENKLMTAIKMSMDDDIQSVQSEKGYENQFENYENYENYEKQEEKDEKDEKDEKQGDQEKEGEKKEKQYNLEEVDAQFKKKLQNQLQQQKKKKKIVKQISQSPQYKKKQQVQELVQMYLKNPHQYPHQKETYSPQEKHSIAEDVLQRSRLATDFERQLLKVKEMQSFVPTNKDDIMTSHLLNLKEVYENQQTQKLKQELFPNIEVKDDEKEKDLSFESDETPPPKTIRQHVEAHSKKFPPPKKNNSKNFLAINKMRVYMLEENRKQKQKQFIEDQSKKNAVKKINKRKAESQKKDKQREMSREKQREDGYISNSDKKSVISRKSDKSKKNLSKKSDSEDNKIVSDSEEKKTIISKQKMNKIQQKQGESESDYQNELLDTQQMEFSNKHSSLDREKKQLQKDIKEFQDEIRSYISGEERFQMYQQFVNEDELDGYIKELVQISTSQLKHLNNNPTIRADVQKYSSVLILVAKDKNNLEMGIGVFHKEFLQGYYICDYIIAHNMRNFLNLIFNFSRYIFKIDQKTNKIEYFFDLKKLQDEISILHFMEFQEKIKRLGQVYIAIDEKKQRKYVLRRNLFQPDENVLQTEGKGIEFGVNLRVHEDYMRQRKYGFKNSKPLSYTSQTAIVSSYLKKNEERLAILRKNAEEDLKYRELLLTTLMFIKKEVQIKYMNNRQLNLDEKLQLTKQLHEKFHVEDNAHIIEETTFSISQQLPAKVKRCTFDVDEEQINYVIHFPQEPLTKIQSSNSSQTGIFMGFIPKYKILFIEANEFMTMNKNNPEVNIFFYVKHFIKNIVDVQKETYPRVFIPEIYEDDYFYLDDLSEVMRGSVFSKDQVKLGWANPFSNSVVFPPSHKDFVIRKPFIISLLSANVERVIEGTPLYAKLIS